MNLPIIGDIGNVVNNAVAMVKTLEVKRHLIPAAVVLGGGLIGGWIVTSVIRNNRRKAEAKRLEEAQALKTEPFEGNPRIGAFLKFYADLDVQRLQAGDRSRHDRVQALKEMETADAFLAMTDILVDDLKEAELDAKVKVEKVTTQSGDDYKVTVGNTFYHSIDLLEQMHQVRDTTQPVEVYLPDALYYVAIAHLQAVVPKAEPTDKTPHAIAAAHEYLQNYLGQGCNGWPDENSVNSDAIHTLWVGHLAGLVHELRHPAKGKEQFAQTQRIGKLLIEGERVRALYAGRPYHVELHPVRRVDEPFAGDRSLQDIFEEHSLSELPLPPAYGGSSVYDSEDDF